MTFRKHEQPGCADTQGSEAVGQQLLDQSTVSSKFQRLGQLCSVSRKVKWGLEEAQWLKAPEDPAEFPAPTETPIPGDLTPSSDLRGQAYT